MNPKHTTRARRAAPPSTQSGTVGVAAPTAPVVTNARESSPTTGADRTPAAVTNTSTAAVTIVRAILSGLTADTAAALVALLVQWFRALAGVDLSPEAGAAMTDDTCQRAHDIGAEAHARAIVAVFMVDGMHDTARASADMRGMIRGSAADALDVLGALGSAREPSSPTTARETIARAILATLAPDTAAALLVLLVQWFRDVLSITGPSPEARQHAAELSADGMMLAAAQLGAREHTAALVAALVGITPCEAVEGLYCEPLNPCMQPALREALDVLGALDADALAAPPHAPSGLDGARGARVLRASLADARRTATLALMNAAADCDDAPAALAAVFLHRDEGASTAHTLLVALVAAREAARLAGHGADAVRGDIDTAHNSEAHARRLAGSALHFLSPGLDALTAAVDVLRALADGCTP